ncbi:hypothetical protein [Tenacibaculum agarivorans]|uniref:hypothetical protein n=1 Tax=Tenacibaculum agarivorans TaxID=1908389 RepID=UPI000A953E94|nr:hypothetical protein [Tenacibaculum agarivorans]
MRKTLLLFFTLFTASYGFGQNIIDIFYKLPSEIILNKTIDQRKKLVDYYFTKTIKVPESKRIPSSPQEFIKTIDKANGFMEIYDGNEGAIQICYWNQNNNEKLIAINYVTSATFKETVQVTFYKLTPENQLITLEKDNVIPYSKIHNRLLKSGLSQSDNHNLNTSGILSKQNIIFDLPRFGKKIKAKFGWNEIDDKERYIARKECALIWKNYQLIIAN